MLNVVVKWNGCLWSCYRTRKASSSCRMFDSLYCKSSSCFYICRHRRMSCFNTQLQRQFLECHGITLLNSALYSRIRWCLLITACRVVGISVALRGLFLGTFWPKWLIQDLLTSPNQNHSISSFRVDKYANITHSGCSNAMVAGRTSDCGQNLSGFTNWLQTQDMLWCMNIFH